MPWIEGEIRFGRGDEQSVLRIAEYVPRHGLRRVLRAFFRAALKAGVRIP